MLIAYINKYDGINDKNALSKKVKSVFHLSQNRSVFCGEYYTIRFCKATSKNFSNTVLSLSALKKYDQLPFIVCIVTPKKNYLMLANTTFLRKISHSSQELRIDNIKGSFNGSDIMNSLNDILNEPDNFESLFTLHQQSSFNKNLLRLTNATNGIHPIGHRFLPSDKQKACIMQSIQRTIDFFNSNDYEILNQDLTQRVNKVKNAIGNATFIDNVNLRGRIVEYLVTADDHLQTELIDALQHNHALPKIFTADSLGDYEYQSNNFITATDIKTKALFLSSNPKGYNIDKLLSFLANKKTVYLIYIIGVNQSGEVATRLCSIFNRQLLEKTRIIKHWAGRNSRGVTQYDGTALEDLLFNFDKTIDIDAATAFIEQCLNL